MTVFIGISLLMLIIYISLNKSIDLLEPGVLFCIIILTTYFLSCLRLSSLQSIYPIWFSLLIISMIGIFTLGSKTAYLIAIPYTKERTYSISTMKLVISILWILIVFSFFMTVRTLGAPPAISGTERSEYFVSGWGSIVLLQLVLTALLLYDRYHRQAIGKLFWFYLFSIVVMTLLFANKFQIIYLFVLILTARNTYGEKIRIRTLVVLSIIIVLLFIFLFVFIYENMYGISMKDIYINYYMRIPNKYSFLSQPYLYLAFNFENLYHFLISPHHSLYGYKTLNVFIEVFHLEGLFSDSTIAHVGEWKNFLKVPSLTTGTMFEDFAQDGGIPMMSICTFVCGFWSSFCYRKYNNNKNFEWFFMYAASIVAIFFSFFSNAFTSKVTMINISVALFISFLLKKNFVFDRRSL